MKNIYILLIMAILSGCNAIEQKQSAGEVRITNQEPGSECTFLGSTIGHQGDFFYGSFTSNKNLEIGAHNALKNKAADMGGNLVVIITQRAANTAVDANSSQTNVTITGNVYRCPK